MSQCKLWPFRIPFASNSFECSMSRETCCALHNRLIDRKTHRRHSARRENPQELAESIRYCTVPMWLGNHPPLVGLNSLQFVWRPLSSPWTNEQAFYWNLKRLGISKAALEGSDGEKMRDPLSRSANFFWRHRTWPDRFEDISINTCWCLVGYWRVLLLWQISPTSIIKTFFFLSSLERWDYFFWKRLVHHTPELICSVAQNWSFPTRVRTRDTFVRKSF